MAQSKRVLWFAILVVGIVLLPSGAVAQGSGAAEGSRQPPAVQKLQLADAYGQLPLSFEANHGQTDTRVKFLSRRGGQTLFLTPTEAVLVLNGGPRTEETLSASGRGLTAQVSRQDVLRMKLLGANADAQVAGLEVLPGTTNYFVGNDPAKWRTNVPTYAKVQYRQIYPGVDLVYYGNQGQLEYDFIVAPGADPGRIRMSVRGAAKVYTDPNGNVTLGYKDREIRLLRPHLYQDIDGQRIEIAGGYLLEGRELVFEIGRYDHHQMLTIDPQLVYSTYLGGTAAAGDQAQAIAIDSAGNAYIAGQTSSTDFPLGAKSPQSAYGGGTSDAFVAKLNAAGNALIYSTYLGGSGNDIANGIAIDSTGSAYVAGLTNSANFPVLSGLQSSNGGGYDAFVTKLSPDGGSLVYSTYLGGSHDETAAGIALDGLGNAYIAGYTNSTDFPLAAPFQSSKGSGASLYSTAFVTKLNAAGNALVYSTYLGGTAEDFAMGIALDSSGSAYVTGYTNSTNFPLASPFQSTLKGTFNAFVSKLNPAGSALSYSTYLGGSSNDTGKAIAVDSSGNAYVAGYGNSTNFPMGVSLQSASTANGYGFVGKFNSTGSLIFSTLLGGSSGAAATSIAVDSAGNSYVTGNTSSVDFPLSSPVQPVLGGASDIFVTVLNPTGTSALYSTYLGGSGFESSLGIAADGSGNAYVTGSTTSGNFPILSPFQPTLRGGGNAFVAKISPQNPVSPAGGTLTTQTAVASSQNPSALGVSVTFTATVTASSGTPSGTVAFSDNGTSLGSAPLSNGQASLPVPALALGAHSVMAAYSGDSQFANSLSVPALLQNVRASASTTTLVSSAQTATSGQPITFTATVAGVGTTTIPTGNVVFKDGLAALSTVALSTSGTASLTTTSLSIAAHSITAVYQGNATFAGSTSTPLGIVVNPPPTVYTTSSIPVGTGPIAAAINPVTHTLFVANQGSNNVTAIDTRSNAILALIPVGQAPTGIAVNTRTNQIYVANQGSDDVTVIDGATYNTSSIVVGLPNLLNPPSLTALSPVSVTVNELTGQVYVGSSTSTCAFAVITGNTVDHPGSFLCGPVAIAVSPLSERAYVAESHDSDVEGYEALTDVHLTDFSIGFIAPVALAIDPPFVYIADSSPNGSVEYFDETQPNSKFRNAVGGPVYAVAVNPVDGEVYAAIPSPVAGQAGTVAAIFGNVTLPVGQTSVAAQIPVPAPNKIAVDSTNDLVLVANEVSNDVTVIDGSALAVASAVPVGNSPRAVLLNPERCNAYVTNFGSNSMTVLNPALTGPGICLSSTSLTFPAQLIGTKSAPQTVTLTNIGNANLLISSIVTNPNVFIESDNCGPVAPATTSTIAPGAQCQIQAAFGPTVPGLVYGQILITDNKSGSPHTIVLTGNGVVAPIVTLTVDSNPAVFGQIVNLTANVKGSLGTPTGTVTFLDGQTVLNTFILTNGTASITPTLRTLGAHSLTAMYSGDLTYSSASSPVLIETVNKAATQFSIFLSSSITSNVGDTVTFESAVQIVPPGSGNATEPGGSVTFFDAQTALGSVPIQNGNANFSISSLTAGSHTITASYPGDSNLLGSTSSALTQVVSPTTGGGTGGGGTGGGGTGGSGGGTGNGFSSTCGCALSGNYVDPAAPIALATTSPHNKYVVTPGSGSITVAVPSGANPLNITLNAQPSWGFSPDDDRFVYHFQTSVQGQPNTQIDNIEVFDLTAVPPRMIVNTQSVVGAQTSLSFSPSGRYFLIGQTMGQTSAEYQIYQVQGVGAAQNAIFDSGLYNFAVGSGSDYQTVSAGFGPGTPETGFVYAFLTPNAPNPTTFTWNLVSLSTGKALSTTVVTNGLGSFWKFNPCGTVVGLVTQTSSNQANVDLYATSFVDPNAAHLPKAASGLPLNLTLFANLGLQEVQYTDQSGFPQTQTLTSDPNCLSNTPTGSNVVVSGGPIAGANQVSVTFGNVTKAGVTAIAPLGNNCPAVPGGFQLASTPPICFDLSTTATYNSSMNPAITVCVTITGSTGGLTFEHFQNGAYVNSTVTIPNEPSNEICAGVQSLSPFAIFQRVPVPLTITANPVSRQYGATDPASFPVSYSGFVNGEGPSVLSGQLSCLSNDTSASPVGSYTIDCSSSTLSSPNYVISYVKGALNVTPAPLTLSADNKFMTYGMAMPPLTFTPSGFVNGDTAASLSTQPTLNTAATASSSVGSYAITIGGAVDPNYTISYVPGSLSITPASLTLTASSGSRPYGVNNSSSNPPLVVSVVGLQNRDAIAATYSTAATPASPVGQYAVVPSSTLVGPANVIANYAVTSLVNGTLTVVPETTSVSISFSPVSIPVGQSTTATVTLTAPDMQNAGTLLPNDPSVLAPITVTSPVASDILSNNGVCTPVPSAAPGVASCTITLTSVEPNGRTLNASFGGSGDLVASSGAGNLIVTAALTSQQVCITSDFRNVAVPGGSTIWFNSIFKVRDVTKQLIHVSFYQSSAQFQYTDPVGNAVTVNQKLPDANITIDPNATSASTTFDPVNNVWITTIPFDLDDNSFLTGMPWIAPAAGLPADVEPVNVCGTFASDVATVDIGWRWAAAAYSSFGSDNTTLGVKPMDTDFDNPGANHDLAGTPENYKQFVIPGARGKGGKNYTGSYSRSSVIE